MEISMSPATIMRVYLMSLLSTKTLALAALIAVGAFCTAPANAAVVRDSNDGPVLTQDDNCVVSNWEGMGAECDQAKAEARGVAMPTQAEEPKAEVKNYDRTVFFDFNKSTLSKSEKARLDQIAAKLSKEKVKDITIVGYADRMGKADYDQKLAKKRAETVRAELVKKGVKAKKVEVRSLGKTAPKANCAADLPRAQLIDCLHDDRRVEIEVVGATSDQKAAEAPKAAKHDKADKASK